MKGVSEIIAIILILMIVIALAALAYTWFSGVFASITGSANTEINANTQEMTTQFKTEASRYGGTVALGTNVTIRNIGTTTINVSQSAVYIAGVVATFQGVCNSTTCTAPIYIPQYGTAVIYNISNSTTGYYTGAVCNAAMTVTIGTGLTDTRTISC